MDGSLWSSGYTVVTSVGTSCSTEFTEVQFFPQCTIDDPGCTAVANVSNMHDATSNSCITDIDMFIEDKLGYEQPLLGLDYFITTACKTTDINTYRASAVFIANGSCLRGRGAWYQASMDPTTGATTMSYYTDAACEERSGGYDPISRAELCAHTCNSNIKFYSIPASAAGCATESTSVSTSHDNESTSASTSNETEWTPTSDSSATDSTTSGTESTSGTGTIAGAVGGGVSAVLIVVLLVWCLRRRKSQAELWRNLLGDNNQVTEGSTEDTNARHLPNPPTKAKAGSSNLWEDPVIVYARVPREKVKVGAFISRGGFSDVHQGTFNDRVVAIKTLLPSMKRDERHINEFLAEIKMMIRIEHPHVVAFVGVAWDALSDLCVMTEFMAGGDLLGLLKSFNASGQEKGFNRTKSTIALQIAHALTYLHSMASPVIHRDLKSRNVLLSEHLDAKLTDMGVSRERVDGAMTVGIGTMLWMAPEVMTGGLYNEKADMFSFGVLLAELDTHTLPYEHARKAMNGNRLTDAALLTKVSMGELRVEFSAPTSRNATAVVELGNACVSLMPSDRPSAAEALYRLQTAQRGFN